MSSVGDGCIGPDGNVATGLADAEVPVSLSDASEAVLVARALNVPVGKSVRLSEELEVTLPLVALDETELEPASVGACPAGIHSYGTSPLG